MTSNLRKAYAQLLRRLRRYRDSLFEGDPHTWRALQDLYLEADFERAYWTEEQLALIQPNVRAIFIGLLLAEKITEQEFFLLADQFLGLRRAVTMEVLNRSRNRIDTIRDLADRGLIKFWASPISCAG